MDIDKMLAEQRDEREGIEQAIMVPQRSSAGRPPAWMSAIKAGTNRPPGSKNRPMDE
jgi:hypothetical protein